MSFDIGERKVGGDAPVFIIAEIGQNHQGNLNLAKKLIKIAKDSGADCAKFQKSHLPEKFNKTALERPYTSANSWGPTYGAHKRHLELTPAQYTHLQAYANEIGILFTASAMDAISLDFLASLRPPFIKIGSGDCNNLPLIERAAKTGIPLIISTGMTENIGQVSAIYKKVRESHANFALMHCISAYPTPLPQINLKVIDLYKNEFPDIAIGYSGHEIGKHVTLAAVAMGAKVIERHITLDKTMKGSDHACSLDPTELRELIAEIRDIEAALGAPVKRFQPSEADCHKKLGKSLVSARFLQNGAVIQADDLKIKVAEPKGIDGRHFGQLVGKKMAKSVQEDESIMKEHILGLDL